VKNKVTPIENSPLVEGPQPYGPLGSARISRQCSCYSETVDVSNALGESIGHPDVDPMCFKCEVANLSDRSLPRTLTMQPKITQRAFV
jgi:hypothetical protein